MNQKENIYNSYKKYETYKILKSDKFKDLNDYDKNRFVIKVFNDTFKYLESIDLTVNKKIYDLFITIDKKDYKIIVDYIIDYTDTVYNFYNNIEINVNNYYTFKFVMFKLIILLYSYYYISLNLKKKINIESIISQFNLDLLKTKSNDISVYKMMYEVSIASIKNKYEEYISNIFMSKFFEHFNILIILEDIPKIELYKNQYITIPQYMGNCWYISIMTALCYSDLSKKIILSKIDNENKEKLKLSKTNKSDKVFIETVNYIINNITKDYKKYNDDISIICDELDFFKQHIMDYIFLKYYELKKNEKIKEELIYNIGTNDYYYLSLDYDINKNKNKTDINKIKILTLEDVKKYDINVGAGFNYAFTIINSLYNIFNITTLYLFDTIIDDIYYRQKNIEYEPEKTINSPDIIFIQKLLNNKFLKKFFLNLNKNEIKKEDKETIIYKGNKYKLDYILHLSDVCYSREQCGHCISGIHYNGEQYYHDSGHNISYDECGNKEVYIPCPFVGKKWVDDIDKFNTFKGKNDVCLFNIQKCFYKSNDIHMQRIHKNFINENERCFSNTDGIISAYIKVDENIKPKKERSVSPVLDDMPDDVSPPIKPKFKPKPKKERPVSPVLDDMPNDVSPPIKPKPKKINNSLCDKWLANKLINPETSRKIKENGPTYKKFVKLCLKNKEVKPTPKPKKERPVSPVLDDMPNDVSPPIKPKFKLKKK